MSFTVCRRFQHLLSRIIVPVEASCRCSKHQASPKLSIFGQVEPSRAETNTYPTGQFFLHRVLDYRGVILFPWIATIREKDPCKILGEKNSTDDVKPSSAKEVRSKKRPYYTVLRDNRDAPYLATEEVSVVLGDAALFRGSNSVKGLDYVAHEDIIPYTSTERTAIDHELFNELFMPDAGSARRYVPREVFAGWQKESFPWSCCWNVYKETTEDIRVTVIPYYMGYTIDKKPEVLHWWGYFVRLENLGEHTVQVIGREWNVICRQTDGAFQLSAPGINGRKPVLSTTTPQKRAFQYNSHIYLKDSSGLIVGKYLLEREDQTKFECRVPPFNLDSKTHENNPT